MWHIRMAVDNIPAAMARAERQLAWERSLAAQRANQTTQRPDK
jgi:hypothetical protein